MASVTLKDIVKIYPPVSGKSRKKESRKDEEKANLKVTKDGVLAVDGFSMDIQDKEFVVLVGPSGCGKSTTLRMIAGLEDITGGDLFIGEERVNDLEPKDRDIAMVFQNYALYPHMSVYDNMAFALKKKVKDKEEIRRKVMEAAEILGITEYLDRKPKNLSGGQRQRVAIGRAIVRNPKVMLMDEPLSNLDAKLRNQMRSELMRLRRRIDTTFVYVTHDQSEAMTLGDRIVVMKDGRIQQIGTPDEVFSSPSNIFVASFIGIPQMNFFDASLLEEGGAYTVVMDGKKIPVSRKAQEALRRNGIKDATIKVGVRPDSITANKSEGMFEAKVGVAEHMGSTIHLHLDYMGRDIIVVTPAKDDEGEMIEYRMEEKLFFSFSPEKMYLFSGESGENIGV